MEVLLAAGATLYDAERPVNILWTLVVREEPSIELLLGSSIDVADVTPAVLQAAAYFQRYNILFEFLPMEAIPQPFPLGYQSPVYTLLEGLMPVKPETGKFHTRLCCEIWATFSFLYTTFPGQPGKEFACNTARTAASEAIMKLAQIDKNHICASAGILHLASYLGMLQVVQVSLELGVDINQHHDSFGYALIAGIEGGSLEVVRLLLERHIDVNTTSSDLGTPLYPAYKTQHMWSPGSADHVAPSPGTALHKACQNGNREMVEILLQHGAEANVLIPSTGAPMHIACERRDQEMLRLLITYGATSTSCHLIWDQPCM
ncbi:hypothetical protein ACEQ8H_006115 [Pleosporales sp. CAS-2024a]